VRRRDENGELKRIRCAHASFEINEDEGSESLARESVEIRCLVLGGDLEET
jgi:hypothetical protein